MDMVQGLTFGRVVWHWAAWWMLSGIVLSFSAKANDLAGASDMGALSRQFESAWHQVAGRPPPIGVALAPLIEVERTQLGVTDGRGVRITAVLPGSTAERMGLKARDIVLAFNGVPVHSPQELAQAVSMRDPHVMPVVELHATSAGAAPAPWPGAVNAPITDCGPNPTLECSARLLRDSWRQLRDALR
ncbi:PDZ domain-containing protein [Limnohabitans sp.]|uniref:PDZ domain-containing protein n=1 Tax=Limnohabitans sp. TaxID=1907725 RepID=UPI0025C2A686|nr:PDZ domain-containing protein [Limnohabitans sp.]